jgi:predicted phosphodiesterase
MKSILHMSDPHFGTERPEVIDALRILASRLAPDALVLSGDITQRGRRGQFRRARAFVDSLGTTRALIVPGNHDIPLFDIGTRLLNPYREFRRAFGHGLEPELEIEELLVLCVNTTCRFRHKDGVVSGAQIARVASRLQLAQPDQLRVVVVHQPIGVMRVEDKKDQLHGAEGAIRSWAGAGADLVLGGHIHYPYVLPLHDQIGGLARRLWAVQAGTAVSTRVRPEADNSVNFIRYTSADRQRLAEVERWEWRPVLGRFERICVDTLELSAQP